MAHISDANSQVNVGSIKKIDARGFLVHDEMNCSLNQDVEAVGINTVKDGGEYNGNVNVKKTLSSCNGNNEPILGKLFAKDDDAYTFYNCYAMTKGFGIRKHWNSKSRTTGEIIRRVYVCNKEGKKHLVDKGKPGVRRRQETRTGCMARMEVALTKNREWVVDKFNDVHNHTITPTKVLKHRSHRKFYLSIACKAHTLELNQSGHRLSQATGALISGQEVDITPRQCSDCLRIERKNNVGRECNGIIKHFQEKAITDGSHYFIVDLAKDGFLRSVFWADGRSRESYLQFGDVVIFDLTYKTNKLMLPFASFIGVNHHRQPILFGAALLEDETEETFVWLFEQFSKCMFHRPPIVVITDQDEVICNAIKKVFPTTRHRFSAWHIGKHALEQLQSLRSRYKDFSEAYNKWVKSRTIEEFEMGWETLNEKFVIEKGSWLTNMYNLRHHWANAYWKDIFLAGMTTSGRSGSMHVFFDEYVNAGTTLNEFVQQYDKAVKSSRYAEEDEDFMTINSKRVLFLKLPIEEQVSGVYSRNVFALFQSNWKKSIDYVHEKLSETGSVRKYIVGLHVKDKCRWRIVEYDSSGDISFTCTCGTFETEGILCKHILHMMTRKQLQMLPKHYILRRWTIDARYQVNSVGGEIVGTKSSLNENGLDPLTLWAVRLKFNKAVEVAKNSPTGLQELDSYISSFLEDLAGKKKANKIVVDETVSQVDSSEDVSQLLAAEAKRQRISTRK